MGRKQFRVRAIDFPGCSKTFDILLLLLVVLSFSEGRAEQSAYESNLVLTVTTHILTSASDSADGDSIPDVWETRQFGTTYIAKDGTDFDRDGCLDSMECNDGTDPKNPDDYSCLEPVDYDSIDNSWERQYFGNLYTANDGTDWDGDGILDKDEYFSGSNPKQSTADLFLIHKFRIGANGQMLIDWPTSTDTNPCARGYVLVMGSNLTQLINQPIALFTNVGNGTECHATNQMTLPAGFYGIKAFPIKDNRP
jgi:hypothetical protein